MKNQVLTVIRVKMPSSGSFAACPSGDTEYEEAFNKAVMDAKPKGYEVSWATREAWPKDREGYTLVYLYCADEKNALEGWKKKAIEYFLMHQKLSDAIKKIAN